MVIMQLIDFVYLTVKEIHTTRVLKIFEFKKGSRDRQKVRKQVASNIRSNHSPPMQHCILHVSAQV